MGRIARLGAGVVVAVSLGVVSPGSALAKSKLVLSEHEERQPVAVDAAVRTELLIGGCDVLATGTILSNDAANDKIAVGSPRENNCGGENGKPFSISGGLGQIQVASTFKVKSKLSPKVVVTHPDGCIYTFTKAAGQIEAFEGNEWVFGITTGKLNKKASPGSCAPTESGGFFIDISSEETETFSQQLLHYEVQA